MSQISIFNWSTQGAAAILLRPGRLCGFGVYRWEGCMTYILAGSNCFCHICWCWRLQVAKSRGELEREEPVVGLKIHTQFAILTLLWMMKSHLLAQTDSKAGSWNAHWSVVLHQLCSTFMHSMEILSPPFPNGMWRWVQTASCSLSVHLTISASGERKECLMLQIHCALSPCRLAGQTRWHMAVTWLDKPGCGDPVRRAQTWSATHFQICIFASVCVLLAQIAGGASTANLAHSWTWDAGVGYWGT